MLWYVCGRKMNFNIVCWKINWEGGKKSKSYVNIYAENQVMHLLMVFSHLQAKIQWYQNSELCFGLELHLMYEYQCAQFLSVLRTSSSPHTHAKLWTLLLKHEWNMSFIGFALECNGFSLEFFFHEISKMII